MNDNIIYRPYKTQKWVLLLTIPVGILAFVGAGYCLSSSSAGVICFIAIGIICSVITKAIYDSSKRAVSFEENGLRIIGGNSFDYWYVSWRDLTHAYYTKSYKGHSFLVLAQNELSPKEAKHFANRSANSSRIYVDNVVVIYIDILQNVSKIKEVIGVHIADIYTY